MWHILFPILGTYFYLKVSRFLKTAFSDATTVAQFAAPMRNFSIGHNIVLAGFSGQVFSNLCRDVYRVGFGVAQNYYMSDPSIRRVIFLFYLSKYYEYFDTFLLYAKGKTPIFLQKYHHIGAVFFWHLCYVYNVDAIVYGTILNSGVHTIMYSYYLSTLLDINIRGIRKYITTLQIAQLSAGLLWSSIMYFPPVETAWNYGIIIMFDAYIAGLILMFSNFMRDNYFAKK